MGTTKTPDGEKIERQLPFKLDDGLKSRKGELAAKLNVQIARNEELKKADVSKHNEKIKGLVSQRDKALREINEGVERRTVKCTEVKNYEKSLVEWWFEGEVLESREMRPDERQQSLGEAKAVKGSAKTAPKWQKMVPKHKRKGDPDEEGRDEEIASVHRLESSKKGASSMVDPK